MTFDDDIDTEPRCRCELQELPQNPERKCSMCGEFIAISDIDDGSDWAAWVESMMTQPGRELHESQREPELLGDVLMRSVPWGKAG